MRLCVCLCQGQRLKKHFHREYWKTYSDSKTRIVHVIFSTNQISRGSKASQSGIFEVALSTNQISRGSRVSQSGVFQVALSTNQISRGSGVSRSEEHTS